MADYALVSATGSLLGVEGSEARATAQGRRLARHVVIDAVPSGELTENPPPSPELALRALKGVRIGREALTMSLEEAHRRLVPLFPSKRGVPVKAYQTPDAMARVLLGQNYKTAKDDPREPSEVQGLSMLPNVVWNQLAANHVRGLPKINTCVGASRECIQSCLVYTGQNEADPYNVLVKTARTSAFVREPNAFGRMLFENCRIHLGTGRRKLRPYVRLNVYSDVPWELVFPDLFAALPGLQFYDYTKVPGRVVPKNYDLTFSYSGRNVVLMGEELRRGRRAAVVFLVERYDKATNTSHMPKKLKVGTKSYPIVDGDISDVRPLDPAPAIVGLAYKPPKARQVLSPAESVFIVKVEKVGGHLVAAVVPREQPGVVEAASQDTLPRGDAVLV